MKSYIATGSCKKPVFICCILFLKTIMRVNIVFMKITLHHISMVYKLIGWSGVLIVKFFICRENAARVNTGITLCPPVSPRAPGPAALTLTRRKILHLSSTDHFIISGETVG